MASSQPSRAARRGPHTDDQSPSTPDAVEQAGADQPHGPQNATTSSNAPRRTNPTSAHSQHATEVDATKTSEVSEASQGEDESHGKPVNNPPPVESTNKNSEKQSLNNTIAVACQNCKRRRRKCDEGRPCGQCKKAGTKCKYSKPQSDCTDCEKLGVKCDRILPICGLCKAQNRDCSYPKRIKGPIRCKNCTERHYKCSLTRPKCLECQNRNKDCIYPGDEQGESRNEQEEQQGDQQGDKEESEQEDADEVKNQEHLDQEYRAFQPLSSSGKSLGLYSATGAKAAPLASSRCKSCIERHAKCTRDRPNCTECKKRNLGCVYPEDEREETSEGEDGEQWEQENASCRPSALGGKSANLYSAASARAASLQPSHKSQLRGSFLSNPPFLQVPAKKVAQEPPNPYFRERAQEDEYYQTAARDLARRVKGILLQQETKEKTREEVCVSEHLTLKDLEKMPSVTAAALEKQQQRSKQRRTGKTTRASAGMVQTQSPLPITQKGPHGAKPNTLLTSATTPQQSESEKVAAARERNIDKVILGNISYPAWYPSYYPAAVLGNGKGEGRWDGHGVLKGEGIDIGKGIVVERLNVCGICFAYAREVVDYFNHVKACSRERKGKETPGRRIYVHPRDTPTSNELSIWEVDGEVDALYCQNLSLFAKLFLDNKSVFFDVSSFKYYVLVSTPYGVTSEPYSATNPPPGNPFTVERPEVLGFFSKEKMSWDNNNLACILVFPSWQHKGFGALLMGISYEISRREGILGGPEKPISDLGKKGYKRFWAGEIARWLLDCKESDRKKGRGMVDVEMISKGTFILPDDVLSVLRDMDFVEKAGRGKGTVERVKIDKEAVLKWCSDKKISLDRPINPNGFVEGYAMKPDEEDEEEGD